MNEVAEVNGQRITVEDFRDELARRPEYLTMER